MVKYMVYEHLPDAAALAVRYGEPRSIVDVFRRMIHTCNATAEEIAQMYNVLYRSYAGDDAAIIRDLMPVALLLVNKANEDAMNRLQRYERMITVSFHAQLARQLRRYFPGIRGTAVHVEEI